MRPRGWIVLILLLSGGTLLAAQTQQPLDSALEAQTRAVSAELRCPVCQGESIQDSPAALAQEMKAVVREQLAAGRSPDEVKAYFVEKYGEWILLRPKARGWNVLVYALPVLALVLGAAVVTRLTRRWTTPRDGRPVTEVSEERVET